MSTTAKTGFTMIELSISLVFIGILSIMMILIISDTVASYRRGVTLNRINTVGMDLVDDMRSAVQNSSAGSLIEECNRRFPAVNNSNKDVNLTARNKCIEDNGYSFVAMVKSGNVLLKDKSTLNNVPLYGAFCTGDYSYIWNSGYFDANTGATVTSGESVASLKYRYKNINNEKKIEDKLFRLLKVRDTNRAICASRAMSVNNNGVPVYNSKEEVWNVSLDTTFDAGTTPLDEEPVDLILLGVVGSDSEGNKVYDDYSDIALYDLSIASPAESLSRENLFYSASFILGTIEGGVNITSKGKSCAVPTDYKNELFDYCAINNFSFAAQANGEK